MKIEKTSPPIKEDLESVGVKCELEKDKNYKSMKNIVNTRKNQTKDNFFESVNNDMLVYLSMGSNVGDREENLRKAVDILRGYKHIKINAVSSIYETGLMYLKNQNFFITWFYM